MLRQRLSPKTYFGCVATLGLKKRTHTTKQLRPKETDQKGTAFLIVLHFLVFLFLPVAHRCLFHSRCPFLKLCGMQNNLSVSVSCPNATFCKLQHVPGCKKLQQLSASDPLTPFDLHSLNQRCCCRCCVRLRLQASVECWCVCVHAAAGNPS